jgi:CheY-like chemotaxis protein
MRPPVLLIENDRSISTLLQVVCERAGYDTDLVDSGVLVARLLTNVDYAAAVLDLLIPDVTGFEIIEKIANDRPSLLSRVTIVSAAAESSLRSLRTSYPMLRVLRKPFELSALTNAIAASAAGWIPSLDEPQRQFRRSSIRLGACGAVIVRAGDDRHLDVVTSFGYSAEMIDRFRRMDLDEQYPLTVAVRSGRPVFLASVNDINRSYPMLAPIWNNRPRQALAALPLRQQGTVAGAIGFSFDEPHSFLPAEQAAFAGVADAMATCVGPRFSAAW